MFRKLILFLKKKYNECFFVGATDKLPPPLSKERELEYEKGYNLGLIKFPHIRTIACP